MNAELNESRRWSRFVRQGYKLDSYGPNIRVELEKEARYKFTVMMES